MAENRTHRSLLRAAPGGPFAWPDWFGDAALRLPDDVMRVEEVHRDGEVLFRAEMPGVDPNEGIDVRVVHGALQISAEKRKDTTVQDRHRYRSEIQYGVFSRMLPLPLGYSEKGITASYRDGVLEVRVPVLHSAESQGTRVAVTRR